MSAERQVRRPGGMPPPARAVLPGGLELDLVRVAEAVADEHLARFPDDVERYGPLAREWCVHDLRHLVNWAVLDVRGEHDLLERVAWLAGVLHAREYPTARLAVDLDLAAGVLEGRPDGPALTLVARRLRAAAESVRARPDAQAGPRAG